MPGKLGGARRARPPRSANEYVLNGATSNSFFASLNIVKLLFSVNKMYEMLTTCSEKIHSHSFGAAMKFMTYDSVHSVTTDGVNL